MIYIYIYICIYYNYFTTVISINNVYITNNCIHKFKRNLKFVYIYSNTKWPTVSPLEFAHFCIVRWDIRYLGNYKSMVYMDLTFFPDVDQKQ